MKTRLMQIKALPEQYAQAAQPPSAAGADPFAETDKKAVPVTGTGIIDGANGNISGHATRVIGPEDPSWTAGMHQPENLGPCTIILVPTQHGRVMRDPAPLGGYYFLPLNPGQKYSQTMYPPDWATEVYAFTTGNCSGPSVFQWTVPTG
jgi:hypothetical protein